MGYTTALAAETAHDIALIREALKLLEAGSIDLEAFPHLKPLIAPHHRYETLPAVELIRDIAEERMRLSVMSIDTHIDLAEAGKERVRFMCQHFNVYAHGILGGHTRSIVKDISQQALDVSIMFVYNHTRGLFMKKLVPDDNPVLIECLRRIELQRIALRGFQASTKLPLDSYIGDPMGPYSPRELVAFQEGFEYRTLDVGNKNMDVCRSSTLLLGNGIRGVHYWRKMLEQEFNAMAMARDFSFFPEDDLKYEMELLRLNDEKVAILNSRAGNISNLGEKVAELDFI